MSYKEWKSPRNIIMGALLAVLASVIQASNLYLPLLGISLSAFSTLFVALSGYLNIITGLLTYLVSAVILLSWGLPNALIFMCSSGLLGFCLGVLLKRGYQFYAVAVMSSVCLSCGILTAGYIIGVPILPWLVADKRMFLFPILLTGSFVYTAVWMGLLNYVLLRLKDHVNI